MDSSEVGHIVSANMTVSDKIRALDAAGYPRAEIARVLGKRYQHVRNVLEADKLRRSPPSSGGAMTRGVAETAPAYTGGLRLSVERDGAVRLPPELLAALELTPGAVVIGELQADGLKLFSTSAAWERVRGMVGRLGIDPSRDLVAELVAERRAEAARDD